MTKKIGKERDNGKQKEKDRLGPKVLGGGAGKGGEEALSRRGTGQSTGKKLCLLYSTGFVKIINWWLKSQMKPVGVFCVTYSFF